MPRSDPLLPAHPATSAARSSRMASISNSGVVSASMGMLGLPPHHRVPPRASQTWPASRPMAKRTTDPRHWVNGCRESNCCVAAERLGPPCTNSSYKMRWCAVLVDDEQTRRWRSRCTYSAVETAAAASQRPHHLPRVERRLYQKPKISWHALRAPPAQLRPQVAMPFRTATSTHPFGHDRAATRHLKTRPGGFGLEWIVIGIDPHHRFGNNVVLRQRGDVQAGFLAEIQRSATACLPKPRRIEGRKRMCRFRQI